MIRIMRIRTGIVRILQIVITVIIVGYAVVGLRQALPLDNQGHF